MKSKKEKKAPKKRKELVMLRMEMKVLQATKELVMTKELAMTKEQTILLEPLIQLVGVMRVMMKPVKFLKT
jgi:hypothetical protein